MKGPATEIAQAVWEGDLQKLKELEERYEKLYNQGLPPQEHYYGQLLNFCQEAIAVVEEGLDILDEPNWEAIEDPDCCELCGRKADENDLKNYSGRIAHESCVVKALFGEE